MLRQLLIGGALLATVISAGASEVELSPPARVDQLDVVLAESAAQNKIPLPPVSRTRCETTGYASCRYRLGDTTEMEASGKSADGPTETVRAKIKYPPDGKDVLLLLVLFMERFDRLAIDRKIEILDQATKDLAAGEKQMKFEGKHALLTLDRLDGEVWITVEGR